jgi:heme/copper-type cytochrome/quinol oxidase subunit 3
MATATGHEVVHEEHPHTTTPIDNRKLLMWVFLASECLFFGALISSYLVFQGRIIEGPTPSQVLDIPLTTLSTFILLMSSLTMVLAVYGIQHHRLTMMKLMLIGTMALGAGFLIIQFYDWMHFVRDLGFTPSVNQFGATFFLLTGFHKAHVIVGLIYLGSLLIASMRRRGLGKDAELHVDVAGLYWHFVDIAWIVIFTMVFLIPYAWDV